MWPSEGPFGDFFGKEPKSGEESPKSVLTVFHFEPRNAKRKGEAGQTLILKKSGIKT